MRTFEDVFDAFWFIYEHPKSVEDNNPYKGLTGSDKRLYRGQFIYNLDIMFVKINPVTRQVDENPSLNTLVQVWLETGPAEWSRHAQKIITNTHDPLLDVGGATFEEALIKLAYKILKEYGDYDDSEI